MNRDLFSSKGLLVIKTLGPWYSSILVLWSVREKERGFVPHSRDAFGSTGITHSRAAPDR